jgi:hypothetical protein
VRILELRANAAQERAEAGAGDRDGNGADQAQVQPNPQQVNGGRGAAQISQDQSQVFFPSQAAKGSDAADASRWLSKTPQPLHPKDISPEFVDCGDLSPGQTELEVEANVYLLTHVVSCSA